MPLVHEIYFKLYALYHCTGICDIEVGRAQGGSENVYSNTI